MKKLIEVSLKSIIFFIGWAISASVIRFLILTMQRCGGFLLN